MASDLGFRKNSKTIVAIVLCFRYTIAMTKFADTLYDIAADNYGIITSSKAREAGITNNELVQYAKRGRLERVGQGVYRLAQRIPEKNDAYALAVALAGPDSFLYGEAVLGMLALCPVNPAYLHVATPRRTRKALPGYIRIVNVHDQRTTCYDGIPSQNVADAIRSCKSTMLPERLTMATEHAFLEGYIGEKERDQLLEELGDVA